ncbi:Monocarboxylate transporter, putative, partial [Gryllus bimaculatus]
MAGGKAEECGSQVDRRAESPAQDKQVVQLLAPPGGKAAEAAATAGAGAGAERLVAKTRPAVGGAGDEGDADEATASGPAPPPDGGWGWVVVFASFMIHIVNDGVTYSFGIFYDALITYFESGRGETAWILSILVGVTLCSGPISSSFVNRYGCRPVTIAGAILGSISLALSVFATNVQTLYLTIGLGTGLGFGLVYLPAI